MKVATLCYIRKDEKTLMLHRVKKTNDMHDGKWNGLGGKIENGETPEECVVREVEEESGLRIKNPTLKGYLTFPPFCDNDSWLVFVYVVKYFEGELIVSNEGNLEWIPNSELLNLNLWGGDKIFLPWLDGDKIFSGKFNYDDEKNLVDYSVVFY